MKIEPTVVLLSISFALASCHKSSSDIPGSLIGKWKLDSIQVQFYNNGNPGFQTIYKSEQDYYDYRADSKLYRYYNHTYDTVFYHEIKSNGGLLITYKQISATDTVKMLTNQSLLLTNRLGGMSKLFFTRE